MRKGIALFLLFLIPFSAFGQGTQWFKGSFDEALAEGGEQNKLIMLFFYSQG